MRKPHLFALLITFFAFTAVAQSAYNSVVHFDTDSSVIKPSEIAQLDSLCRYLKSHRGNMLRLVIAGHCDSTGSWVYNDALANRRAYSVKNYLAEHGIEPRMMNVLGYGKRNPLNDNGDSSKRSLNRRVEITVYLTAPPPVGQTNDAAASTAKKVEGTIDLGKLKADSTIVLENINFYPDEHVPLSGSFPHLKALLNTLQENPGLKIEIRGFVCCLPITEEDAMDINTYTRDLSLQRAKFVYSYLVYHGIDSTRLSYHGYGGGHPLVKEITDEDRTKNRRVEIKILSR